MSKIIGVTVGTPISPSRIEKEIKPIKTVNGVTPDENGNVEVVGNNGADGKDGATFTPSVSADGVLSWTNDKGLNNPTPMNIKGAGGKDGVDGISPTVSLSKSGKVTTLEITDKNGTQKAEILDGSVEEGEEIDLMDYAKKSDIPTKISAFDNDKNYLTSYTETDPTVPSWAKADTKPTYTASEVGALPANTKIPTALSDLESDPSHRLIMDAERATWNNKANSWDIPTKTSELTNDSGYLTSAPVTSVNSKTGAVVLSASDVGALPATTSIPSKLSDLTADSTHRVVTDTEKSTWNSKANTSDIPTKVSQLTNDKDYLTSYTETDPTVPSWAKASTKPSYTKSEVGLGNVDNVKQYSASNPPPYPVTSVNSKTGAVSLSASDVGADASGTADSAVSAHNTSAFAHTDIRAQISRLSSEKVDKYSLTLGVHTDGLVYIFINGSPQGNGLNIKADVIEGDVFGWIDENNNIILSGDIAENTYSVKYEMGDGTIIDIGELTFVNSYTVTNSLTNCTTSNLATSVAKNSSYSATISAKSGYDLSSVVVTMGGDPVSVSNGVINITSVTGNIVITAVAEVSKPAYTNLAKPSDANWKVPYRINSGYTDTEMKDLPAMVTTNYIAVKPGDVIRVKNIDFKATNYVSYSRIIQYNNGTGVNAMNPTANAAEFVVDENGITTITVKNTSPWYGTFTHIRLCGKLTGTSADVIITKNEAIA